jgi:hypothetical protein
VALYVERKAGRVPPRLFQPLELPSPHLGGVRSRDVIPRAAQDFQERLPLLDIARFSGCQPSPELFERRTHSTFIMSLQQPIDTREATVVLVAGLWT